MRMSKEILEQLQFEKNKREILKQNSLGGSSPITPKIQFEEEASKKYAWEYELERYKKEKLKSRFYMFGSMCGILALILTLLFNMDRILDLIKFF